MLHAGRKYTIAVGAAALALLLSGPALAPAATTTSTKAAAPSAASVVTGWSTSGKSHGPLAAARGQVVSNVRGTGAGYAPGLRRWYDRVVFDTTSSTRARSVGFFVRYVRQVLAEGSGNVLSLSGAYKLQVVLRAPDYNDSGQPTYYAVINRDLPGVSDGRRVVDTVYGGGFEGQTTFGIGLNAKRAFRVVQLSDGRVAVDILR